MRGYLGNRMNYAELVEHNARSGLPVCLDHFSIIELWTSVKGTQDQRDNVEKEIAHAVITGSLNAVVRVRRRNNVGYSVVPVEDWRTIRDGWFEGDYIVYEIHRDDFRGWQKKKGEWPLSDDCLLSFWWQNQEQVGPDKAEDIGQEARPANAQRMGAWHSPGELRVIVDDINGQVTVFAERGKRKLGTYSRADIVGKGTATWDLLVDFAKCKGSLEGNTQADVKKRNTSANRGNLGKKLMGALRLDQSPFVEKQNGIMKFSSISLASDRQTPDALDRQTVSIDDQTDAFLASHGEDMPVD